MDPETPTDPTAIRHFHEVVYERLPWPDGAVLAVTSMRRGRVSGVARTPVADLDAFVQACVAGCDAGADVYVNVAPQPAGLDGSTRGGRDAVLGLPALFADVDVDAPGHKASGKQGYPLPTEAEAIELIQRLPLAVTLLVHTGGGYHTWCCLDEPLDAHSSDGQEILRRWKHAVSQLAAGAERHLDVGVLADPARMLRVPGTVNHKIPDNPRPVRLLEHWLTGVHLDQAA